MSDLANNAAPHEVSLGGYELTRRRHNLLTRNRYQLLGGLLLAVICPALLRNGFDMVSQSFGAEEFTLVGTGFAMLLGAYLRRRLAAYPGDRLVASVVPAFGTSYGLAVLGFFFLRLDYSRFQFGASFILVLGWFALIAAIEPRASRQKLYVVPAGKSRTLIANKAADWVVGRSPEDLPPDVTGVVADMRAELAPEWEALLARATLSGLPVYHWKQLVERLSGTVDIEHVFENNLGSVIPDSVYPRLKRVIDLAISFATLPLTLPTMLLVALAILVRDGRPVFFRQTRIGYRGQPFTIVKFRTMRSGSEMGVRYTELNDPRITALGRILRQYRFDELPQILNVIRGEMSWIGPRPESKDLADWYRAQVPFYSYRYIVRPGITGWAQVNQGNVARIEGATGKLRYDFYYIKYLSPWLDLAILMKTVRIVLSGFGSR